MLNYEFLNDLMTDPQIAAILRRPDDEPESGPMDDEESGAPPSAAPGAAAPPSGPAARPSPMPAEFPGTTEPGGPTLLTGDRPENRIPGPPQKPGFWRGTLPKLIQGAISGAATPSQYGGGALDIFRAMQGANQNGQQQDMLAYQLNRQRALDAQSAAEHQAKMEDYQAQAKERSQIGDMRAHDAKAFFTRQYEDALRRGDSKGAQDAWDKLQQVLHGPPKPEKPVQPIKVPGVGIYDPAKDQWIQRDTDAEGLAKLKFYGSLLGLDPALPPDQIYAKLSPEMKANVAGYKPTTPQRPPAGFHEVDDQGRVTQYAPSDDGKWNVYDLGTGGKTKPPKEKSAAELKRETQTEARTQASKIWLGTVDWLKKNRPTPNGSEPDMQSVLALSRANLQQYFPDMENFGDVDSELQRIGRTGGLTQKSLSGGKSGGFGGQVGDRVRTGQNPAATPPAASPATGGNPAARPMGGAQGGAQPKQGPPPEAVAQMKPGVKTRFRNGEVWMKDPQTGAVHQIDPASGKVLQ